MSRSNMFVNLENQIKNIKKEDLLEFAHDCYCDYGQIIKTDSELLAITMIQGIRFGVSGNGEINKDEKEFIRRWFEEILKIPQVTEDNEIYDNIKMPIIEKDYKALENLVSDISEIDPTWGVYYLRFILTFAYCDGKFEDNVAERLDKIFGMSLLMEFAASGKEEVPKPKQVVKITELEKEVYEFIKKTSGGPLEEIQEKLNNINKFDVESALESLFKKGLIDRIDNIIRAPWYIFNDNEMDDEENKSVSYNSKQYKEEIDYKKIKKEILYTINFLDSIEQVGTAEEIQRNSKELKLVSISIIKKILNEMVDEYTVKELYHDGEFYYTTDFNLED